jgi:hypothetical protein
MCVRRMRACVIDDDVEGTKSKMALGKNAA